ncbi:PREDICTED: olfactory receptor 10R2-like [Ceratotherium simum simum]|uniref:Olfactory receptor 10R2-like n=1 Tax=Ceratotherium simum simum TaxID=73337 RepID=A0ABM1DL20_CERSS|nr:PREDICTED: olfactory receptor 10R2-like [Ceratotherium simum simum]
MTTEEPHSFNIDNEHIEIVKDFVYLGSVISLNVDCSQEIKRRLRFGRAVMKELEKSSRIVFHCFLAPIISGEKSAVNLQNRVNQTNFSSVTEFLLLGFSSFGEIQLILFAVFLCLYLIILSGNITIVTVICLDHSLHIPMYLFLGILSISETCYTFVILPKMLINLLSLLRTISFINCATRMFFFLGFAITNCMLLGVMGYDHYAAICHPLRYPLLMSWQVCGQLAATCAVIGFLFSLIGSLLVFELPFCGPNKINHYFCDITPVIRLACTDTYISERVIFIGGVLVLIVPLTFICISYGFIVCTTLRIPSAEGKRKAFSTCASHLTVVIVHYGCSSFVYLRPSAKYSSSKDKLVTVTYTVVTPLLNSMVYSRRNKDVQVAIWKVIGRGGFYPKAL